MYRGMQKNRSLTPGLEFQWIDLPGSVTSGTISPCLNLTFPNYTSICVVTSSTCVVASTVTLPPVHSFPHEDTSVSLGHTANYSSSSTQLCTQS